MRLNVLIATIDDRILGLKNIIGEESKVLFVISHQVVHALSDETEAYILFLTSLPNVIYSTLSTKGVAMNRNNTLRFIEPLSICLILDDDVILCKNIFDAVLESFEKNPTADFISYKILNFEDHDYKRYPKEKQWHTLRTLTGIGTTEMAFRSDFILQNHVAFDERFGPGSENYPLGEDFIFAMDLYHIKAKMLFLPIPVVKHLPCSTGGSLEAKVIFARGAVFARVYGWISYPLDIIFAFKHKKRYQDKYSMLQYLKLMLSGSKSFLERKF